MQSTLQASFDHLPDSVLYLDPDKTKLLKEFIQDNVGHVIYYSGDPPTYMPVWVTPYHVGGCI